MNVSPLRERSVTPLLRQQKLEDLLLHDFLTRTQSGERSASFCAFYIRSHAHSSQRYSRKVNEVDQEETYINEEGQEESVDGRANWNDPLMADIYMYRVFNVDM